MPEKHNIYIIIDDQEVNLFLLEKMINNIDDNAMIFKAESGVKGLEIFKDCISNHYNIKAVICDLQMPVMDGEYTVRLMCEYYRRTKGEFINEIPCKFSIFTANDLYVKPSECGNCDTCGKECGIDVFHKPVTKEKAKEMMNYKEPT
jgi:CheY-like chemotaxis protein